MSSLARYFLQEGYKVRGYDKTQSRLTDQLITEGADIHFEDLGERVRDQLPEISRVLVVYTPAIPSDMKELMFFKNNGYEVMKRAQLLGLITKEQKTLAVAGTHGKTTTSCMLAHVIDSTTRKCNAFLGGISTNFGTNYKGDKEAELAVVEADEFDRSFLNLNPYASIVTTTDADHLDIYGSSDEFAEGFKLYSDCVSRDGFLLSNEEVNLDHPNRLSYGKGIGNNYQLLDLQFSQGKFLVDVLVEGERWSKVELGLPGEHNALNAVAVLGMLHQLNFTESEIRDGLKSFKGVKRRFEYQMRSEQCVFIDDYAHHPTEIKALISSVKQLYPGKKIKGVFQPHLFSRTRDFFEGFAKELSELDELILMPIYPARELPIPGVTSEKLLDAVCIQNKQLSGPADIIENITCSDNEVLLTIGAGDIDRIVEPIKNKLQGEVVG